MDVNPVVKGAKIAFKQEIYSHAFDEIIWYLERIEKHFLFPYKGKSLDAETVRELVEAVQNYKECALKKLEELVDPKGEAMMDLGDQSFLQQLKTHPIMKCLERIEKLTGELEKNQVQITI